MAVLGRAQIDAADDRQWEDVPVDEWGGEVRILGMSGTARNLFQKQMVVIGDNGKAKEVQLEDQLAKLLAKCIVGEDFKRLYTDAEIKKLGAKNGAVLERLAVIAKRLSGLGENAVKDAAGKSEATPSDSSTSG
jgi:hypothetical protein